jgi:hypothetical protein
VITIAATTAAAISGMLLFCIYVIYRVRRRIAGKLIFSLLIISIIIMEVLLTFLSIIF